MGLVAVPLLGAALLGFGSATKAQVDVAYSLLVGAAFIALLLLVTEWWGRSSKDPVRKRYGYLEIMIGLDGRSSTSKAIVWIWTLVFATALMLLSAMTWFSDLTTDQVFGEEWDAYLLLLGGPFAAAVAAKGITSGKTGTETGTKSPALGAAEAGQAGNVTAPQAPRLSDVGTTDAGNTSLPDTQYMVFSFVAIVYFIGAFIDNLVAYANDACADGEVSSATNSCFDLLTLPSIPAAILGLTSASALTYVGAKAVSNEGVRMMDVKPNPVFAGGVLTLVLVNLPKAYATTAGVAVKFTVNDVVKHAPPNATEPHHDGTVVTLTVLAPVTDGVYQMTVTTVIGTTPPVELQVDPVPPPAGEALGDPAAAPVPVPAPQDEDPATSVPVPPSAPEPDAENLAGS